MAHLYFKEAFSLGGRYFPAGTDCELPETEAALVPEWVAIESDAQLTEGGVTTGAASVKTTKNTAPK